MLQKGNVQTAQMGFKGENCKTGVNILLEGAGGNLQAKGKSQNIVVFENVRCFYCFKSHTLESVIGLALGI